MVVSTQVLVGPCLKIERANLHIDELQHATVPLKSEWYSLRSESIRTHVLEARPSRYNLRYNPERPIAELLALVVGDAIHNLRSALDHLAGGIIRSLPDPPKFKPSFPIHPNRENLKADRSLAEMEKALPGSAGLLLEKLRPADGPDEALWRFNDLSNLDKHNLIIPSVAITNIIGSFRIGTNVFSDCGGGGDAAKPMVLLSSDTPITIEKEFKAAVDVTFGKGNHTFEGKRIIPTLHEIVGLVSSTVNEFRNLINKQL